jgi:hypothetical protein
MFVACAHTSVVAAEHQEERPRSSPWVAELAPGSSCCCAQVHTVPRLLPLMEQVCHPVLLSTLASSTPVTMPRPQQWQQACHRRLASHNAVLNGTLSIVIIKVLDRPSGDPCQSLSSQLLEIDPEERVVKVILVSLYCLGGQGFGARLIPVSIPIARQGGLARGDLERTP